MTQHFPEKFVVIGSNCFSGASFVDFVLSANPQARVIGISRSTEYPDCLLAYRHNKHINNFTFHCFDMNHELDEAMKVITAFRPNYVVNFAAQGMVAQSWINPEQWFATNGMAVMNLANRLSDQSYLKRYVQVSSPEIYGACDNVTEETAVVRPSTPYAASKAWGDISLMPFFLTKGFPVTYTRATNVYGPYQQLYRIVPKTILSIKKGVKIPLQGGGRAVKSYIHIKDVCDATLAIARSGRNGELYHISPDGDGIAIRDLVALVARAMGRTFDDCVTIVEDRLGQDAKYVINSAKIRNELGWKPRISLEVGVQEVIDWVNRDYECLSVLPMDYIHKP